MALENGFLNTTTFDRTQYNVIGADVVAELTPYHKRVVAKIKLSANPVKGDVYEVKNNKEQLALTKNALLKIADLAGVHWNYAACGAIPPTICHFCKAGGESCLKCPHFGTIAYKAVGAYQDAVGQWRALVGSAEIDPSVRGDSEGQRMKPHLLRHTEARAFNAAIRTLGVKQSYNPQELTRPFLVIHTYFDPHSDPDLKKLLYARELARLDTFLGRPAQNPLEIEAGENVVRMLKGPEFTEVMRDMEASVAQSVDVQTGEIVPAPEQAQAVPYQPNNTPVVVTPAQSAPPQSPMAKAMNRGELLNQLNLLHREWYPSAPGIALANHLKKSYGPMASAMSDLNDTQLREQIAIFADRLAERKAAVDAQPQPAGVTQ